MKLHIIAAIVDTTKLTMYLKDGSTKTIQQGDPLLVKVLEEITPQLLQHKEAFYDLEEVTEHDSDYVEFEGRTNGVVRFFKIAKNKLAAFLSTMEKEAPIVEPVTIGDVSPEVNKMKSAVAEIISASEKMIENSVNHEHTVIAVVDNDLIPNADSLSKQITAANAGKVTGLINFMERVAKVASKRMHSVNDLMKFMQLGDLPIADDGSIIIYKVLKKSNNTDHSYVDCHTKNVPQSVGSYVCMDESLVDHNRNNECSNGLHVARRGYLGSFSGDVCVLAKVAPEDVIAVPKYDANKMRVSGYHILFEIPQDSYAKLKANRSMTDTDIGQVLLGKAMSGDHVGKLQEVRITQHKGEGIVIKSLMTQDEVDESMTANIITSVDALGDALITEDTVKEEAPKAPTISPINIVKDIAETKDTINNLPTRVEMAQQLYQDFVSAKDKDKEEMFQKLEAFKKKCKCSWDTLNLSMFNVKPKAKVKEAKTPPQVVKAPVTRQYKVAQMMKNIMKAKGAEKVTLAHELLDYKKKCKVSFESLGLGQKDIDMLQRLTK